MFLEDGYVKTETKADPFSLESLIAWLETQDPDRKYDYCDPENCLLCQFFAAHGFEDPSVWCNYVAAGAAGDGVEFPMIMRDVAAGPDAREDWTFGEALDRARKAVA